MRTPCLGLGEYQLSKSRRPTWPEVWPENSQHSSNPRKAVGLRHVFKLLTRLLMQVTAERVRPSAPSTNNSPCSFIRSGHAKESVFDEGRQSFTFARQSPRFHEFKKAGIDAVIHPRL